MDDLDELPEECMEVDEDEDFGRRPTGFMAASQVNPEKLEAVCISWLPTCIFLTEPECWHGILRLLRERGQRSPRSMNGRILIAEMVRLGRLFKMIFYPDYSRPVRLPTPATITQMRTIPVQEPRAKPVDMKER